MAVHGAYGTGYKSIMTSARVSSSSKGRLVRVLPRAAIAASVIGSFAACHLLAGLEQPDAGSLDASDERADDVTVTTPDANVPLECRPGFEKPPPPSSGAELDAFGLALSFLSYVPSSADAGDLLCPAVGLALDDKLTGIALDAGDDCSSLDAACGPSCRNPNVTFPVAVQDYAGGVDNGFLRLRTLLLSAPNLGNSSTLLDPTPAFRAGKANLLLKVSSFNGEENDDDVGVGIFESPGLESGQPAWDGTTSLVWKVLSPGNYARGFVRDSVLMVEIVRPFMMPFVSGAITPDEKPIRVGVESGRLKGRLVKTTGGYAISSGQLALVLSTKEIVRLVSHVPASVIVGEGGVGRLVCDMPDIRPADLLCRFADLASKAGGDCDRLSLGAAIRAGPAELAEPITAPNDPDRCAEAGGYDPNTDCDYLDAGLDR